MCSCQNMLLLRVVDVTIVVAVVPGLHVVIVAACMKQAPNHLSRWNRPILLHRRVMILRLSLSLSLLYMLQNSNLNNVNNGNATTTTT